MNGLQLQQNTGTLSISGEKRKKLKTDNVDNYLYEIGNILLTPEHTNSHIRPITDKPHYLPTQMGTFTNMSANSVDFI